MKRTVTEILIEVEETVCLRKTEQSAPGEGKLNAATSETTVCPFCGGAFPQTENLENQNKLENRNEKE